MSEKIRVLYAEDELDIQENIVEILNDEGFEVFAADNGKQAVQLFLEKKPDVVVSDIMMPEMSGYEFLQAVRDDVNIKNNNVPFIFLSALGQKEDIIKGVDLKVNDYLTKPVDFQLLVAKIKEKYNNSKQIALGHKRDIDSIKGQVSDLVPSDLIRYLSQIKKTSKNLKTEPYGPLPHKKYLDDIGYIYMCCIKMSSAIETFMNGEVLNNQLNANEEIINSVDLINQFIGSLDSNIVDCVQFVPNKNLPNIKIDKSLIVGVLRRMFNFILNIDSLCKFEISFVEDHLGRLVLILYLNSNVIKDDFLLSPINSSDIGIDLRDNGYDFDISSARENEVSILLYVPSYKVIKNV
jgi:CheY-like chemotaxis protein